MKARPEADNLVGIYAALAGTTKADVLREFGGGHSRASNRRWSISAVDKLGPIGEEMKRLMQDPGHVDAVLAEGAERARAIAAETMKAVKDIVGFVQPK